MAYSTVWGSDIYLKKWGEMKLNQSEILSAGAACKATFRPNMMAMGSHQGEEGGGALTF